MTGRFAPSPTGDLHLGNLRTAVVAWLSARSQRQRFVVRMEDLDRQQSNVDNERTQLRDLAALGLDWDGEVVRQSDRFPIYDAAIADLRTRGLVYECFCTRREILAEIAASSAAPHGPPGSYPGTCRELDASAVAAHRAAGRRPALRLRTDGHSVAFDDRVVGRVEGTVDDVVLRRNDGVPAYNLAVVVDDGAQGIDDVVRGDDLVSSTARQIHLQRLLGLPQPTYTHVPLVLGTDGERLAKRHGAVTLGDLEAAGVSPGAVLTWIAGSVGLAAPGEPITLEHLVDRYDPSRLPTAPTVFDDPDTLV